MITGEHSSIRYLALVTDYDDTLEEDGRVMASAAVALEGLRTSGRRFILETLVYAAPDEAHNNAVALKAYLETRT